MDSSQLSEELITDLLARSNTVMATLLGYPTSRPTCLAGNLMT
jgi:hypothetical protein